jgi:serine/threonine protein kinase
MRARAVTRSLPHSSFVPGVAASLRDACVLVEVLHTHGLCTLDMLLAPELGPLDEASAVYVAASVVLGLEQLHRADVAFRGLSASSILVTEGAAVQLVDFRHAARLSGNSAGSDADRCYTLCGAVEYAAPEMVVGRAHGREADLWALGVLVYALLTGATPFAEGPGGNDDPLTILSRVAAHCPPHTPQGSNANATVPPLARPRPPLPLAPLPAAARDLVSRLLTPEPSARLGAGSAAGLPSLKGHPWFASVDWPSLLAGRGGADPPEGLLSRVAAFEGVKCANFTARPHEGDCSWAHGF